MGSVDLQMTDDARDAALTAIVEGRPSTAIALLHTVIAVRPDDPLAALLLARAYVALDRAAEAAVCLAPLLDARTLPDELRPLALALDAHIVTVTADPGHGRRLARAAIAASTGTDSAAAIAGLALGRASMYEGDLPGATRIIRRTLRTASDALPDERAELGLQEAFLHLQRDRFSAAEGAIDRADRAVPPPTPRFGAMLRYARGAIRFHAGPWDGIDDLLDPRPAVAAGVELGDDAVAGMAGLLSVVLVHRDELARARELVGATLTSVVTGQRPFLLWGSMLIADADDDRREARRFADRLIASFSLLGSPGGLRIFGIDLVRVLVDLGDRGRAVELAATLESRVARSGTPSVAATADLMAGIAHRDAARLRRAADGFRGAGRPLELATALEHLGRLLTDDDRAGAIAAYRDAVRGYERLAATRDARRVEAAMRDLGVAIGRRGRRARERVGLGALSPTEAAVARLVADGSTNAEIGRRLAISPRTVESHVAHALAKLGARNRSELAALVARAEAGRPAL